MTAGSVGSEMGRHVIAVLEDVVSRHGASPAIEDERGALSYAELWKSAGGVAIELTRRGIRCGDVVAVRLPRTRDAIIALVGIWRAGAVYLPIDAQWPDARVAFVHTDADVRTTIDGTWGRLDALARSSSAVEVEHRDVALRDPAYVIYTSGSTGVPKGVIVPHRGLESVLSAQIRELRLAPGKRCLLVLSLCFDASLSDIGTCLLSGATLVIDGSDGVRSPAGLVETIDRHRITHVDLPPSLLRKIDPSSLPASLEQVIVGGEVCPAEVLRAWARKVRVAVAYGPTEATICTSMARCDPDTWSRPLIGTPLPGVVYEIVDERGVAISDGMGELLISSPGLALGYQGRPDLDRERFIIKDGRRWFRTGDRVRRVLEESSGEFGNTEQIEFVGRVDRQIKVRGALVAPEEIEARLTGHPEVTRAAVVWRELSSRSNGVAPSSRPGTPVHGLVAFVEAPSSVSAESLRAHVRAALPGFMCPQRFEVVDAFEMTSSGKIDLEALRHRTLSPRPSNGAPLQGEREGLLAQCWSEVLGVDEVFRDDDFFALGGDSFAALELVAAGRGRGLYIAPSAVYERPILARLAEVTKREREVSPISNEGTSAAVLRAEVRALVAALPKRSSTRRTERGDILLTGATGFLGARVLKRLLEREERTDRTVHCLVRASTEDEARRRLLRATRLPARALSGLRILCGDVARPKLGLTEREWMDLAGSVADAVHLAAAVDMVRPFRALSAPNLGGTVEVLRLVREGAPKRLHYASTLSVFVATDRHEGLLREDDPLDATETVFGGYAQTKWASEIAVRMVCPVGTGARRPGGAHDVADADCNPVAEGATIHRFGLLTSDAHPFAPPAGCQLSMFLRGLAELGCVPDIDLDALAVDVTPVDFAARAFVELAFARTEAHSTRTGTFHIANPKSLSLRRIVTALEDRLGRRLARIPANELGRMAAALPSEAKAAVLVSLARRLECERLRATSPLVARRSEPSSGRATDLFLATRADFDTSRTVSELERAGIVCPAPEPILDAHLAHLVAPGADERRQAP